MRDDEYLYAILEWFNGKELLDSILALRDEDENEEDEEDEDEDEPPRALPHRVMREDRCRGLFTQLCSGLMHLQQHRIVHGDISCENVMLHYPARDAGGNVRHGESGTGSTTTSTTPSSATSSTGGSRDRELLKIIDFGWSKKTPVDRLGRVRRFSRLNGAKR